jgi:ATP-dependent helicase YprA (DUF1998 family)
MKKRHFQWPLAVLMVAFFAASCTGWGDGPGELPGEVEGYKPIYMPRAAAFTVDVEPPATLLKPGKIYIYHGLLLVVERLNGIHVINNQDPTNPQAIAYIKIPGCVDVAVNSGMLYADNLTDLVVFNIADPLNISFERRIQGAFPQGEKLYPEAANNQYFECVDTTKGVVVEWELTTLKDPKCYR